MIKELKKKVDHKHLRVVKDTDTQEELNRHAIDSLEQIKEDTQRKLSVDPDMTNIIREICNKYGVEKANQCFFHLSEVVTQECFLNSNFSFSYAKGLFLKHFEYYKSKGVI